jgi:hypothetical protein
MESSDPVEGSLRSLEICNASPTTAEGYPEQFSEVRRWCTRLGMVASVIEDWAMWHTNPATAMIWLFTAQCAISYNSYVVTLLH